MSYTKDAIVIAFWVILIGALILTYYAVTWHGVSRYWFLPIVLMLLMVARARRSREGPPTLNRPKYIDQREQEEG